MAPWEAMEHGAGRAEPRKGRGFPAAHHFHLVTRLLTSPSKQAELTPKGELRANL